MKKLLTMAICFMIVLPLVGCAAKQEPQVSGELQIQNPWKNFENLEEAEKYAGFKLGIPETVSDTYKAVSYSVMAGESSLLQVVYQDGEYEVIVRKSQDVGQDISGVYGLENEETVERNGVTIKICRPADNAETPDAVLAVFDYAGFAWSVYAPNGYWGDSGEEFLIAVFND